MTEIVLVRHAQTALNRDGRIRGRMDPPLDDYGLAQARETARHVARRWQVCAVYSSPLRRAKQTARAIAEAQGLEAHPIKGLLDLDFGEWNGLSVAEARSQYPNLHRAWNEKPHTVCFPRGEGLVDVQRRVVHGISDIVSEHGDETVCMVGHSVVNRVIVCTVLGISLEAFWRFGQGTCAVNLFAVDRDGKMTLNLLNDTYHVAGAGRL
jgi:broad specificity phosphatase PhoE